jgi:hypothetical protein
MVSFQNITKIFTKKQTFFTKFSLRNKTRLKICHKNHQKSSLVKDFLQKSSKIQIRKMLRQINFLQNSPKNQNLSLSFFPKITKIQIFLMNRKISLQNSQKLKLFLQNLKFLHKIQNSSYKYSHKIKLIQKSSIKKPIQNAQEPKIETFAVNTQKRGGKRVRNPTAIITNLKRKRAGEILPPEINNRLIITAPGRRNKKHSRFLTTQIILYGFSLWGKFFVLSFCCKKKYFCVFSRGKNLWGFFDAIVFGKKIKIL